MIFFVETKIRTFRFNELKINESRLISLENSFLFNDLNTIVADLNYLQYEFENPGADTDRFEKIAEDWVNFSSQQGIFSHIQFIDINGDEKIRINLGESGGYIVPEGELQNKKESDYFIRAIGLGDGGIYISRLDLSKENGKVIEPYMPVMHFSKPAYDTNGKFEGIIVLCYLADNILQDFRNIALDSEGEIVLLDPESYWVSSTNKNQEYGFMFEGREGNTFSKEYAEEWAAVLKKDGQIVTSKGLFTFQSLDTLKKITTGAKDVSGQTINPDSGKLYMVSLVPRDGSQKSLFTDKIFSLVIDILKKSKLYFLLSFFGSALIAVLIYINRMDYNKIHFYSLYDTMTKVYNRRAGIEKLNKFFPIDERRSSPFSICFIDINGLKVVNDILGHKEGDELILEVVNIIKSTVRESDFIIRMGGDEFLIVFTGIDADGAESVWLRIKSNFEEVNLKEDRPYLISVSHGMACYSNEKKLPLNDLMKIADEKMYGEKRIITRDWNALK